MKILVTGGAGYIGSHTCVELLLTGYEVVVVDNFDNSKPEAIHRIEELANQSISFYEADVRDEEIPEGTDYQRLVLFIGYTKPFVAGFQNSYIAHTGLDQLIHNSRDQILTLGLVFECT